MSGLLNLVQSLEMGLTNPDGPLQKNAFRELNDGFRRLPLKRFTDKEVLHVVDFYVSRLTLSELSLTGVILEGLLWFADQKLLNAECAVKICGDGLFSSLNVQSLCKYERRIACRLFLALLSHEPTRSGLISMKLEFIRGFIVSVEGEKDPECLMLIFSMHPLVLQHFELVQLAEEHFDTMAAYFPVDYTPPPRSVSEISRSQLVEKLRTCLWAARSLDGGLLLPMLLDKATSPRPEARSDALSLLADCLVGVPQAVSFLSEFQIPLSLQRKPIPTAHVTAYLFALCNMVKQMNIDLDVSDNVDDVNHVLCIVAGLSMMFDGHSEEINFVETLLRCLWPEGRSEEEAKKLDGWFAVVPAGTHVVPVAPQDLVADCLITAVLSASDGPLLSILFRRIAAPFLWPKVDPLPSDACFYQSKLEQIISWTPHISFLNRLLEYFSRYNSLSLQVLRMNEEKVRAVAFNFLHTLKRSLCELRMCDDSDPSTELATFGLICRFLLLLKDDDEEIIRAFLSFCPHIFEHLVSTKETTLLHTTRVEQLDLLAKLVSNFSLVECDLLLYLFTLLQDGSSVELQGVAIEILQRAACNNSTILNNLLTLLFQRCSDSISLTPAFQLISSIHFITKSLVKNDEDNVLTSLASFLQVRAADILHVAERLISNLSIKKANFGLADLLSSMRLVVSGLSEIRQMKAFTCYMESAKTVKLTNPCVVILLECAVISALRPTIPNIPLGEIVDLLFKYFTNLYSNRYSTDPALWIVVFNELCVCSTTLINKFPDDVVAKTLSQVLNVLLEDKCEARCENSLALTSSRFVILTLRGLLVSQLNTTTARQLLMERLIGVLLATDSPHPLDNLQHDCLFRTFHLLSLNATSNSGMELETEEEIELSPLDEEVTHCFVNPLAVQKSFCLVGLRLRDAWKRMTTLADLTTEQALLEEAFLHGYLRLASLLPDDVFSYYISGILEAAVLAAADNTRRSIGPRTQALGLFIIARKASHRPTLSTSSSLPLISSFVDADDFLEKLSHLRLTCASFVSTSSLRFNLARCLRFLVDLPPIVTARHRGGVRRLLEDLLDDDCQSVRLEAARAHNEWCLKV